MFVWNIDPDLFHLPEFIPGIGGRGIRYYGVIYALALMGGLWLWSKQAIRGGHTKGVADRFYTPLIVWGIAGARLGHCLFYDPARYLSDPITILYFWQGGLASHGGALGILGVCWWFGKKENIRFVEMVDRVAFGVAFAAICIRLGNFMNSEIVGRLTNSDWGFKFPRYGGDRGLLVESDLCGTVSTQIADTINGVCYSFANIPLRHPSQLYEVGMGVAVILILFIVDRTLKEKRPLGLLGALFLALYFTCRFFVEYFKEFQTLDTGLTMGQWLSIPLVTLGVIGIILSIKKDLPAGPYAAGETEPNPGRDAQFAKKKS